MFPWPAAATVCHHQQVFSCGCCCCPPCGWVPGEDSHAGGRPLCGQPGRAPGGGFQQAQGFCGAQADVGRACWDKGIGLGAVVWVWRSFQVCFCSRPSLSSVQVCAVGKPLVQGPAPEPTDAVCAGCLVPFCSSEHSLWPRPAPNARGPVPLPGAGAVAQQSEVLLPQLDSQGLLPRPGAPAQRVGSPGFVPEMLTGKLRPLAHSVGLQPRRRPQAGLGHRSSARPCTSVPLITWPWGLGSRCSGDPSGQAAWGKVIVREELGVWKERSPFQVRIPFSEE